MTRTPHHHFIPMAAGETYGRLTIVEDRRPGSATVLARCECGVQRHFDARSLRSGHTASCGCLQRDSARLWRRPGGTDLVARPKRRAPTKRRVFHPLEGDDDL